MLSLAQIPANQINKPTIERLERIVTADPLQKMTDEDKALLWVHRHHFVQRPAVINKFLQVSSVLFP